MKRFLIVFLTVLVAVCLVTALAACDILDGLFGDGECKQHELGEWHEGSPATCWSSGQKGYYICKKCGKRIDKDGVTEINDTYIDRDPNAHQMTHHPEVPATCVDFGTKEHYECTVCGQLFTDASGQHATWKSELEIEPLREHNLVHVDAVAKSCTTDGVKEHWHCSICDQNFEDQDGECKIYNIVIPKSHDITTVYGNDPSCTKAGNVKYYHCESCGNNFSDYDCTTEISDEDIVRGATGHDVVFVAAVENTHDEDGNVEHWHCNNCGNNYADQEATTQISVTIPKGHHWGDNGICKECDQEEYSDGLKFTLQDNDTYKVSKGSFNRSELIIPSMYEGKKVTAIAENGFKDCTALTQLTLTNNVYIVDKNAFKGCTALESVTILRYAYFKENAFEGCEALTAVYYNGLGEDWASHSFANETSNPTYYAHNLYVRERDNTKYDYKLLTWLQTFEVYTIPKYAFINCTCLEEVGLFNNPTVEDDAFKGCTSLESIAIPYSAGARIFGGEFPASLKTIKFTTSSKVKTISQNTFTDNYAGIEKVILDDKLTSIGYNTFSSFTSLKTLVLPKTITTLYDSFENCTNLQYKKYGNGLYLNAETWQYAYLVKAESPNVTDLTVHESCLAVAAGALKGCSELETLKTPFIENSLNDSEYDFYWWFTGSRNNYYSKTDTPNFHCLTFVGDKLEDVFVGIETLKELHLPSSVKTVDISDCTSLESLTIPNTATSVSIADCTSLTQLSMPLLDNLSSVNPVNLEELTFTACNESKKLASGIFKNYTKLESVTLPSGLTTIDSYAFSNCTTLTDITIPASVTSIETSAFTGCSGLTKVNYLGTIDQWAQIEFANDTANPLYNGGQLYIDNEPMTAVNLTTATKVGNYAFNNYTALTDVAIGDSVTSIGESAFSGCSNITDLAIGNGTTNIGSSAFAGCSSLTSVTISDSATSIGTSAFNGCSGITDLTIGNSVTSIGKNAFDGCSGLTNLTINSNAIDTTNIYQLTFSSCSNLASLEFGNNVTNIGDNAFQNCSSLTSVTLPNSVTSIGESAFSGCSGLTDLTIGNGMTSVGASAFDGCSALTKVNYLGTIDNWAQIEFANKTATPLYCGELLYVNDQPVTEANFTTTTKISAYAFTHYTKLTNVTIGDSVTSIGDDAFSDSGIVSLTINSNAVDTTSICSSAFNNCSKIVSLEIGNGVTSIGDYAFFDFSKLATVTISNSVTSVGEYAFRDCSKLTNVNYLGTIDQWAQIEFANQYANPLYHGKLYIDNQLVTEATFTTATAIGSYAFNNYKSLTTVTIPSTMTSIGANAFDGCSGITKVNYLGTIDQWAQIEFGNGSANPIYYPEELYVNDQLVTEVNLTTTAKVSSYAFYNYKKLTDVTLGDNVTSIGNSVFAGCTKLKNLTLGKGLTSVGSAAFWNCSSLDKINVIGTIDNWAQIDFGFETSNPMFYAKSLYVNDQLVTVAIPELTTATKIGNYAFSYWGDALTEITIPDSVTSIGESAFSGCSSLASVTLGSGVTSIGKYAFRDCSSLTSVTLGDGLTSIGTSAFGSCKKLTKVNFLGTIDQWAEIEFSDEKANPLYYAYKLHVNDQLVTEINLTTATKVTSYAFYINTQLTAVTLGDSVTSIGKQAFYKNTRLVSVTIGNGLVRMDKEAFAFCDALTKVNYLGTIDQWVEIDFDTYAGYSNPLFYAKYLYINDELVTEAKITTATTIKVFAFYNCASLTSIEISNSVTSIGASAFKYCPSLTSITISNSVTSIGTYAFFQCTNLASVTFEENSKLESIGADAFSNCKNLTSITIPSSVTSIGKYAFSSCQNLTSIIIPANVASIEECAFNACTNLTIYCEATRKPSKWDSKWNYHATGLTCTVVWGYTED